jgi:hypothetical protein
MPRGPQDTRCNQRLSIVVVGAFTTHTYSENSRQQATSREPLVCEDGATLLYLQSPTVKAWMPVHAGRAVRWLSCTPHKIRELRGGRSSSSSRGWDCLVARCDCEGVMIDAGTRPLGQHTRDQTLCSVSILHSVRGRVGTYYYPCPGGAYLCNNGNKSHGGTKGSSKHSSRMTPRGRRHMAQRARLIIEIPSKSSVTSPPYALITARYSGACRLGLVDLWRVADSRQI